MMNRFISVFLVFSFLASSSVNVFGQTARADSLRAVLRTDLTDVERIKTAQWMFGATVNNKPDTALKYARLSFRLSATLGIDSLHGQSIMNLTHAYFVNNHIDSAKGALLISIPFYEGINDYFMVSASYRNLAVIGEVQEQPDTSLKYLDKCLQVLANHPDSLVLGDVYLSKGFAYRVKGYYELSTEALLDALRVFEDVGNSNRMGYASQNLGLTLYLAEKLSEAISRMEESVEYFGREDNVRATAQSLNNIGTYYRDLGNLKASIDAHKKSLALAVETEQNDVILDNALNLSTTYIDQAKLDSAQYWSTYAIDQSIKSGDDFAKATGLRYNARIAIEKNNYAQASQITIQAETLLSDQINPKKAENAYLEMSSLYEELGNEGKALHYWKKARVIADSLYSLKKNQQIEELNLIYLTEKKDAQISLLNKQQELDAVTKKGLIALLVLLSLLGFTFLYALSERRKKEKEKLLREKEAAAKKLELTKQKLNFKQKELTAKALQLARKNEFLGGIEKEIKELRSTLDTNVNITSDRIIRMIQVDTNNDSDWEQFGKEFSSVHQDFLDRLKRQYGSFTKSELRLIALLKMNISSKDIANTLRITDEGIKKARYRLRKKLKLDSNTDLRSYIHDF